MATKLPITIEKEYYRELRKLVVRMRKIIEANFKSSIVPLIKRYQKEEKKLLINNLRTNAPTDIDDQLNSLQDEISDLAQAEIESLSKQVKKIFTDKRINDLATSFVEAVEVSEKRAIDSSIRKAKKSISKERIIAIDRLADKGTESIYRKAVSANVGMIKNLPEEYLTRVTDTIVSGIKEGKTYTSMSKDLIKAGGIEERRTEFIARDQTGTVYGDITKKRQENLGIKSFIWVTSRDSRVRPSHVLLDNREFDWDTGATGANVMPEVEGLVPGQDYNCRCTSRVPMGALLDAIDDL